MKYSALDTSGLSARNRRFLALGVHGGDGDDALDLDQLLARVEGIAGLSDEDVEALQGDLRAAAELILEESTDEAIERSDRVFAAMDAVSTAQTDRATEAARIEGEIASRRERLDALNSPPAEASAEGGDGDDDNADDGDDQGEQQTEHIEEHTTETETETERTTETADAESEVVPLAATARTPVAVPRPASTRPRNTTRVDRRTALRASANVDGMRHGDMLDTNDRIFRAYDGAIRASMGYQGPRQQVGLATLGAWDAAEIYGEDRTLRYDPRANEERILALTSQQALRASGGICAPPPIDYSRPFFGDDARPVKSALLNMGADRGGVRLFPAVTLADVDGTVGIWTHANDIALSAPATKVCGELDCPEAVTTLVDAITRCVTIGNFRARYSPEQVSAWLAQIGVLWARTAETKILTKIGDGSTQVTAGNEVLGSTREVLRVLALKAAALRSRNRLPRNFPIRVIAPEWLLDNMREDLAAQAPGDNAISMSNEQIEALFSARNINITWTPDGETGQVFDAQANGVIEPWPQTVRLLAFPEGSWVFLDGGSLDFGTVRDSTLNATNDLQIFSEGFENVAFHGVESHQIDVTICASGATAAPVDSGALCDQLS